MSVTLKHHRFEDLVKPRKERFAVRLKSLRPIADLWDPFHVRRMIALEVLIWRSRAHSC